MRLAVTYSVIIFFIIGIFKDVVAGSNTQHIFYTMNSSPLTFTVEEFLGFLFVSFFCFVWCFLVDKINVKSCVSPSAMTRQTSVSGTIYSTKYMYV